VYFRDIFLKQRETLRSILPGGVDLIYSVKANPNPEIIRLFYDGGLNLEVASGGELDAILWAGCSPSRAILVGPAKTDIELRQAIGTEIGALVVESPSELARIENFATGQRKVHVAIRLNLNKLSRGKTHAGGHAQFGMSIADARRVLREHETLANVDIGGIHSYTGTQQHFPDDLVAQADHTLKIASELQVETGFRFRFVDLGGGFGWPTRSGDPARNWEEAIDPLAHVVDRYRTAHPWTQFIGFESGRFLTAPAGIFVSQIQDVKVVEGETFVLTDGGTSNFGFDDRYYGTRAPAMRILAKSTGPLCSATICGPLCTPADRFGVKVLLPTPERGDLLCVFNAGAYGLTQNPGLFLGHGYAAEVMVTEGRLAMIRRRFSSTEFIQATCSISPDTQQQFGSI
jgi:diaminopimelate decarboxylase